MKVIDLEDTPCLVVANKVIGIINSDKLLARLLEAQSAYETADHDDMDAIILCADDLYREVRTLTKVLRANLTGEK